MTTLLFIPAYNCAPQIKRVIAQVTPQVQALVDEILILDNQSTDDTQNAALEAMKLLDTTRISVARNCGNYGLGGSHKIAFEWARTHGHDTLIVLHGDDQGSIGDIIPLLQQGEHIGYDCLLGGRFHPQAQLQGYSVIRKLGNHVFNLLFSLVARRRLYDLGAGLNLYHVPSFPRDFMEKFPDDLTFNYCMILASCYHKQRFRFFPITWREDDQISNVKLFSQAKRVLGLLAAYAHNAREFIHAEHRRRIISEYKTDVVATRNG